MVEQEAQAGSGESLQPADHLHECSDEALLLVAGQLELAPPPGQPDLIAAGYQLKREQHGDDLEHVCGAAGRQRERRHTKQKHEEDRKALLLEEFEEAAQGLVAGGPQPEFELLADFLRLCTRLIWANSRVLRGELRGPPHIFGRR
jgi:hypothetical protein